MIEKKGICIVTKDEAYAYKFKMALEEKTKVRWADGSLPTKIEFKYNLFFIENESRFFSSKKILMGANWDDLLKDAETNIYGLFKDLNEGKYDIYVL